MQDHFRNKIVSINYFRYNTKLNFFKSTTGFCCRWIFIICAVFVLSSLCKILILGIYSIPGSSMESTLLRGDRVLVNKLKYGPRLPRSPSEVSGLNIIYSLVKNGKRDKSETHWRYHRIKGYSTIKRNDIVVFNQPVTDIVSIKRCVGLPGDSIKTTTGKLFINNVLISDAFIDTVKYHLSLNDSGFQEQTRYKLNPGCYFMVGDNRYNSNDSRYWGSVPEENIVGKAMLVLFNYNNNKFSWNRLLKRVK